MRTLQLTITVALLLSGVAVAGQPSLSTDQERYLYLDDADRETVTITFTNGEDVPVYLPNTAPYRITLEDRVVYAPARFPTLVALAPGESYTRSWDLTPNCPPAGPLDLACGPIAQPGSYRVAWSYSISPSGEGQTQIGTGFVIVADP